MRLIDADALIKEHCDGCEYYDSHFCTPDDPVCGAVEVMNDAPTIDAVEVAHGRCKWCNGDYRTTIMATAIRHHTNGNMDGYELKVNYCPNCGAKMDGERKDE